MKNIIEFPNLDSEPNPFIEISDPSFLVKNPLVSVKMITYNHAPYITQAIESVLQQEKNFPIELIIGEDCSTDGTREIVLKYQKEYPKTIRVITSENNVGAKLNSMRVNKVCRGKYIAFCEGDDHWHNKYKLQKQADILNFSQKYGLIYSSFDINYTNENVKIKDYHKYKKWNHPCNINISDYVINNNSIGINVLTCTVMVRRELCERIIDSDPYLHKSGHFLMGDTQLWAEMAYISKFGYIPESLATHNITEESATRSKDILKILKFELSGNELMMYLSDKYSLSSEYIKILKSEWKNLSLNMAFYLRNYEMADNVRKENMKFTFRNWIKYLGAKYALFYYIISIAIYFKKICNIDKDHDIWQ